MAGQRRVSALALAVVWLLPAVARAQFTTDTDWAGADWTPPSGATIAGAHSNIGVFHIPAGTTVYVSDWNGTSGGAAVISAATILIEGTLVADGVGFIGGAGGPGGLGSMMPPQGDGENGEGTGGGGGGDRGTYVGSSGGGGAGHGGAGGVGGEGELIGGTGGVVYGGTMTIDIEMGSGGGGGGAHAQPMFGENYPGGDGGDGGGAITLIASTSLDISGTVSANGSNGANGTLYMSSSFGGGAGGGSGGGIFINTASGVITGVVRANGGTGGNAGTGYPGIAGGGGGGGGRVKLIGSIDLTMATTEAEGGAAGTNGAMALPANAPGVDGTVYTLNNVDPIIAPIPSAVNFGDVPVGAMAGPTTLTLLNAGGADLIITALTFGGPDAASFMVSGIPAVFPVTLAPTTSVGLSITYAPTIEAPHVASVTVDSNDPFSPTLVVSVSGEGVVPGFNVAPNTIDFGTVDAGTTSAPLVFNISNTGTGAVTVTGISIGTGAGDFTITGLPTTPYILAGGVTVPVSVTYSPGALGADSTTVTITSNDPTNPSELVTIDGIGAIGDLMLTPATLDFGPWPVGTESTPLTLTLENVGTDTVVISSLMVAGGTDPLAFVILAPPSLPAMVLPGATLPLDITFTPDATGAHTSYVAIMSDAALPLTNVPLLGTGVTGMITVTPSALSFGNVPILTTSAPQVLTIENTGATDVTILSATLAGATPTSFMHDFPFAGSTLAPGAILEVAVTLSPPTLGSYSGTLTFMTNLPTTPSSTVALVGAGSLAEDFDGGGGSDAGMSDDPPGGCRCAVAGGAPAGGGAGTALLLACAIAVVLGRRARRALRPRLSRDLRRRTPSRSGLFAPRG